MVDEDLRRVERRFRETGQPADEAAYLRAQVRSGGLDETRLRLAAYLGHGPALKALDGPPPTPTPPDEASPLERVAAWVAGLEPYGDETLWRAGAAVVRAIPVRIERFDGYDDRLLSVQDAVEAWILEPSDEAKARIEAGAEDLAAVVEQSWGAAQCVNATHRLRAGILEGGPAAPHVRAAVLESGYRVAGQLERAVKEELIPWALGRGDVFQCRSRVGGRSLSHVEGMVRQLVFSPAGGELLITTDRGQLRVLSLDQEAAERELPSLPRDPYAAAWIGPRILIGDVDGLLRLLSSDEGQELASQTKVGGWIHQLAPLEETRVVAACHDHSLQVWRIVGDQLELERQLDGHSAPVRSVAVVGQTAVSGCGAGQLRFWDLARGTSLGGALQHGEGINGVALTPDGKVAISAGSDQVLRLWDVETRRERRAFEGHEGTIYGLAISPDGRRLASCDGEGGLRLRDLASGEDLASWDLRGALFAVEFSRDGKHLVVGARRGSVRIYDV